MKLLTICFLSLLFLTACESSEQDSPESERLVFLVRHAEKCAEPKGDPELTAYGLQRADDLARMLSGHSIEEVYSTPFKRTMNTARPVADYFELDVVQIEADQNLIQNSAAAVIASDAQGILVVGHSNTTTRVVNELAGTSLPDIEDADYDHLFVVRLSTSGSSTLEQYRYGSPSGPVEDCQM